METVRYCPNCGEESSWDHRFCMHCRAPLPPPTTKGQKDSHPRPGDALDSAATQLVTPVSSSGRSTPDPMGDVGTELGFSPGFLLMKRYRIQRSLGIGGMGRVYLAADEKLGIPVAIKVLREVLGRDPASVKRLIAEAKHSIQLSHPNVVRVHNFEDGETVKFLVMEYVEGGTLADRIADKEKLSEEETRRIAIEICKGLEHAHEQKVIHRDIKPGNILLGKNGSIKIADFGIARECRDSVSRLTSQVDSGTLLYMSPEQLIGKSNEVSDVYSLGVMLYEMLTGDPPFCSGDIPYQIREVVPDPPAGVSPAMSAIVMRCLEKKPGRRFGSVHDLREELDGTADRIREDREKKAREEEQRKKADDAILKAEEQQRELERKRVEEENRRKAVEEELRRTQETERIEAEKRKQRELEEERARKAQEEVRAREKAEAEIAERKRRALPPPVPPRPQGVPKALVMTFVILVAVGIGITALYLSSGGSEVRTTVSDPKTPVTPDGEVKGTSTTGTDYPVKPVPTPPQPVKTPPSQPREPSAGGFKQPAGTVAAPPAAPALSVRLLASPSSGRAGDVVSLTAQVTGKATDVEWKASEGTLEGEGLSRRLQLTPKMSSSVEVQIQARDDEGHTSEDKTVIAVDNTNRSPAITELTADRTELAVGDTVTIKAVATDADNDPLTYLWTSSAGSLAVDGAVARLSTERIRISGSSIQLTVVATVKDGRGGIATQQLKFLVNKEHQGGSSSRYVSVWMDGPEIMVKVEGASSSTPKAGSLRLRIEQFEGTPRAAAAPENIPPFPVPGTALNIQLENLVNVRSHKILEPPNRLNRWSRLRFSLRAENPDQPVQITVTWQATP